MFNELFNDKQQALYLFDAQRQAFALIPEQKRPIYLACHHRNFLILVVFAMISLAPDSTIWLNLAICAGLYGLMTWYYLAKLTPKADWQSLTSDLAVYPTFYKRFDLSKLKLNISLLVLVLLAVLIGISQRVSQSLVLEILLTLAIAYEALRQILIFLALRQNPLPPISSKQVSPRLKSQVLKKKKK